jgi:hypothetical protein
MPQWRTFTPEGRQLVVGRNAKRWTVKCEDREAVQHELLDVALIDALRELLDAPQRSRRVDYGRWTRNLADRIQSEAEADDDPSSHVFPSKGDRIERIDENRLGVSVRGTVEYADELQILVKWDDDRSSSLRVGKDRFRVID